MFLEKDKIEGKKLINSSDNIEMTILNNKLTVCNLISAKLVSNDSEEEESSFFSSIDSIDDEIEVVVPVIYAFDSDTVTSTTDFILGKKSSFNIDSYPEEMQKAISKSINRTKGIGSDKANISVVNFLELDGFAIEKNKELLKSAYISLMKEIKKFKSFGMSDNAEEFIEKYIFKKHLLIEGEKGGKLAS